MLRQIVLSNINLHFHGRFSHTSHIIGESKLLLVGGFASQPNIQMASLGQSISIVDLKSHKFIDYDIFIKPQPLNGYPLLVNHASYIENEDTLKILGGGSNCFSFGMHINNSVLKVPIGNINVHF